MAGNRPSCPFFWNPIMLVQNRPDIPTQVSSSFLHVESYARGSNLIVSKPEGNSIYIGRCYEMSPLAGGGTEFAGLIQNIYKSAPDESVLQITLLCVPDHDVPYNLVRGKTHGNRLLQELVHRHAQLYQRAQKIGVLPNMPAIKSQDGHHVAHDAGESGERCDAGAISGGAKRILERTAGMRFRRRRNAFAV